MHKPIASLSLDLDNQWSYMKNHGSTGWETFPSYLNLFVPKVLKQLDEFGLKITFFIVGQDAVLEKNRKYLKMIVDSGHEIANHSFHHDTWLQKYSQAELEEEIDRAHLAIKNATGMGPRGFRGPGFTWNNEILEVLQSRGYIYDASTFPTFIGPLARRKYYKTSNLSDSQKNERKDLFGKFSDGFRRVRPFFWNLKGGKQLLEIPVTTMPIFRIPIHLTYLVYISSISKGLMKLYFGSALLLCRLTRTRPSFLIHPLDLISSDQIDGLETFPGMDVPSDKKTEIFRYVLERLVKHYTLVPMIDYADAIKEKSRPLVKTRG
ncbi:MAG: polysaccharide deacetylase family protein [Eudoraea sp.]|nr:polysaccharide deacetylase family protein [Eudoraea sp.]